MRRAIIDIEVNIPRRMWIFCRGDQFTRSYAPIFNVAQFRDSIYFKLLSCLRTSIYRDAYIHNTIVEQIEDKRTAFIVASLDKVALMSNDQVNRTTIECSVEISPVKRKLDLTALERAALRTSKVISWGWYTAIIVAPIILISAVL